MHTVTFGGWKMHFNPDLSGTVEVETPPLEGGSFRRLPFPGTLIRKLIEEVDDHEPADSAPDLTQESAAASRRDTILQAAATITAGYIAKGTSWNSLSVMEDVARLMQSVEADRLRRIRAHKGATWTTLH